MKTKLLFLLIPLLLLTACGSSGGGSAPSSARDSNPVPAAPVTKDLTLVHGLGFVCWLDGASPERIWCWASEQAALDNGDAGRIGLTNLSPSLLYTAPGVTTFSAYDHGVCYFDTCLGNTSSTTNVTTETVTCAVTSADTLECPGEANHTLTFAGMTFADADIPAKAHSPTYWHVRRTC